MQKKSKDCTETGGIGKQVVWGRAHRKGEALLEKLEGVKRKLEGRREE